MRVCTLGVRVYVEDVGGGDRYHCALLSFILVIMENMATRFFRCASQLYAEERQFISNFIVKENENEDWTVLLKDKWDADAIHTALMA